MTTQKERAQDAKTPPLALSVAEAAIALRMCTNSVYAAVRSGDLPSVRIGGRIVIPVGALQRKLEEMA